MSQDQPNMLEAALRYARLGYPVFPLHGIRNKRCTCGDEGCFKSAGKHPHGQLAPNGFHDATRDEARITEWWSRCPDANIGIPTGRASGFVVLDIDPRNGGDDTWVKMQAVHGPWPDTVIQLTGGGGTHYLFRVNARRLRSPGKGVDAKDNGGYIVVEPSLHMSGARYAWEGSSDLTDGYPLADVPEWLLEPVQKVSGIRPSVSGVGFLHPQRIADVESALERLDSAHYETWIRVGQALHSTEAAEAFGIWDRWSQKAANYGGTEQKWRTFTAGNGLHIESIFAWAMAEGWDPNSAPKVAVPITTVKLKSAPEPDQVPDELLQVPGVLGEFVRWTNATSPKPQPQFAVQAALALAATVMGRRWRTSRFNFPSLYLVNVGKSASGKEHARTVIEATLAAAGLGRLIGPGGYTSDSAVMSALLGQPCHIAIIDELGALLNNAKSQGNFQKRQSLDLLTQAWGQLHGTLRPLGYSTMGLTARQRQELEQRFVAQPALTLLGMTTPRTFYGALTEQAIEGGFLNRLLIVESAIGPQPRNEVEHSDPPSSVVQWCQSAAGATAGEGNLAQLDLGPDKPPMPRVVPINSDAEQLLRAYEVDCIRSMEVLDREGLAEMEGRSVEKAMRIALLVAASVDLAYPVITGPIAHWAVQYVRRYTAQTVASIRTHMHGSLFGQWRAATLQAIEAAGESGATERELARASRVFAGLDPRTRKAVFDALIAEGLVQFVDLSAGKRGRKRVAWVAVADTDQEQEEHADAA